MSDQWDWPCRESPLTLHITVGCGVPLTEHLMSTSEPIMLSWLSGSDTHSGGSTWTQTAWCYPCEKHISSCYTEKHSHTFNVAEKSCRKPSCYKEGTHQFPNLSDLINYLFNKMIKQKLTYEQQLETEKKTLLFPDDITLTSHIFQKPIALLLRALSWFQDTCIIAFLTVLR